MNDEYPFILEVDNMDNLPIPALAETSKIREAPIIIYSMKPVETRMVQVTKSNCSLDLDTGEFTEEVVATYIEQRDLYQYHVIESGRPTRHKTFNYAASNGNSTYFVGALQEEIAVLRAARNSDENQDFMISSFSGDYRTWDEYWLRDVYQTGVISAVDDGDGWTWKQRYQHEVYRSVYDHSTGYKWWTVEQGITTFVDSGDYKTDYANWVGPWIYQRENAIWNYAATEWDHGPTTSVGSWSYSMSAQVRINKDGPSLQFGLSQSSGQSQVTIDDLSDDTRVKWREKFPPESGTPKPDYFWYPWAMDAPISASHNTYKSYRGSLFHLSSTSSFSFSWNEVSYVHYDAGFWFFFLLFWTRYSEYTFSGDYESYPATAS